jgi:hypothetical protein
VTDETPEGEVTPLNDRQENTAAWLQEDVPPTYEGLGGKVYRFSQDGLDKSDKRADLAIGDAWLIFAPQAHMLWSWHVLFGVSLEEKLGVDPPKKQYPEAEYEFMVWACDPSEPAPDPRKWPMGRVDGWLLSPPDVVVQFHGVDKDQAAEILELCAHACARGHLVPDSDYRSHWDSTIKTTAQHYARGIH